VAGARTARCAPSCAAVMLKVVYRATGAHNHGVLKVHLLLNQAFSKRWTHRVQATSAPWLPQVRPRKLARGGGSRCKVLQSSAFAT